MFGNDLAMPSKFAQAISRQIGNDVRRWRRKQSSRDEEKSEYVSQIISEDQRIKI